MQKAEFRITVKDAVTLRLEMLIDKELKACADCSADEIENFIQVLSEFRAKLEDEVPRELDQRLRVQAIQDPIWRIPDTREANGKLLGLRHPGQGWLWFQFPDHEAAAIAKYLSSD